MSCLIKGLPHELALACLAYVPYFLHPKLELVSRSWKAAIRSAELFMARRMVGSSEDLLCVCCDDQDNIWELYDPLRDLWITLPRLPSATRHHFGVVSMSQKLFVLGGCNSTDINDVEDSLGKEVWSFDPVTRNWSMRAPMLKSRARFACCALDGKIIVAGGINRYGQATSKAEMYDFEKDLWVPLPDMARAFNAGCTAAVIGTKMHIAYKGLPSMQTFDSSELRWSVKDYKSFPGLSTMAAVRGSLYILFQRQGVIFKQDVQNDLAFILPEEFIGRIRFGMIGFRGDLYVIGGRSLHGSENMSDVFVYTLSRENPAWFRVATMRRGSGYVLGCAELRV